MGWGTNESRRRPASGGFQTPPINDGLPPSELRPATRTQTVHLVGSGYQFRTHRENLRTAFEAMGLEVVESTTSAIDVSEDVPIVSRDTMKESVEGHCLNIIMVSPNAEKGPSAAALEKLLLAECLRSNGAVGIVANDAGDLEDLTKPIPAIAFVVVPACFHSVLRTARPDRTGYGMRFFDFDVLTNEELSRAAASTMAEYGGIRR